MNGRKVLIKELIESNTVFVIEYDAYDGSYTAEVYEEQPYFCVFQTTYEAETTEAAIWLGRVLTPYPLTA